MNQFPLEPIDYVACVLFLVGLSAVGYWSGRRERGSVGEYFLAGRRLPWYVVGGSFIASNISTEHFIGMIGAAVVYGMCVALSEWLNVVTFSLLIWIFVPFLLASRVFTIPEFLERRFSPALRLVFALVTILSNVVAFLAAVLYGGALALHNLFAWDLWPALIGLGVVAGIWAIYGGLSSVAWTDLFTVIVMLAGGLTVTWCGLRELAGEHGTLADGAAVMLQRNEATEGMWREAVARHAVQLTGQERYQRLSVFQPASHPTHPWVSLLLSVLSVSIWYNVLNQFMIQRVLGARDSYHARMGLVFAGFLKLLLPVIVVVPGLILFALRPEILLQPWEQVRPAADQGYVAMVQTLVPAGLRGLLLAALFGAIQSTVNSVLNSTATVFTLDVYQRWLRPTATDRHLVWVGVVSSTVVLVIAIVLGGFIDRLGGSLFEYIQSLYAFFAPPFAAVFLLGILWPRINGAGAMAAVVVGFLCGIGLKMGLPLVPQHPSWLAPYANQAALNWLLSVAVCVGVSLLTAPPRPDQVADDVTLNWRRLSMFADLGGPWYRNVVTWWALFVAATVAVLLHFSG
ncbi:MAG: sodium/solute symporter [Pirellulaceae bacterium]|jgi:SSS family solute:Na+ symporter|nr:sodium/solute symporter [Pirellulaceae bacterium]